MKEEVKIDELIIRPPSNDKRIKIKWSEEAVINWVSNKLNIKIWYTDHRRTKYKFVQITNKIAREVIPKLIVGRELIALLDASDLSEHERAALVTHQQIICKDSLWSLLDEVEIEYFRDDKNHQHFLFQNKVVKIDRNKTVQLIDYANFEHIVWQHEILKRDINLALDGKTLTNPIDRNDLGNVNQFIKYLSGMNGLTPDDYKQRYMALAIAIGYLLWGYKDEKNAKAIVFCDGAITFEAAGRNGKGVIYKMVRNMIECVSEDMKQSSQSGARFLFSKVHPTTQGWYGNDVDKSFSFDKFFNVVTEDWQVEGKGDNKYDIPYAIAPKPFFSSNHPIEADSPSAKDRIINVVLHNEFSATNKPEKYFGDETFMKWEDDAKWDEFNELMISFAAMGLTNRVRSTVSEEYETMTALRKASGIKNEASIGQQYVNFINDNKAHWLMGHSRRYEISQVWRDEFSDVRDTNDWKTIIKNCEPLTGLKMLHNQRSGASETVKFVDVIAITEHKAKQNQQMLDAHNKAIAKIAEEKGILDPENGMTAQKAAESEQVQQTEMFTRDIKELDKYPVPDYLQDAEQQERY